MDTNIGDSVIISWKDLYEYEALINESIGVKERFILLSRHVKKLDLQANSLKILDGGGTRFSSYVLKQIFPGSFVVSVNLEGKNDLADIPIEGSLSDNKKIIELSSIEKFDIIFLGEVFEHLFFPYKILNNLKTLIKSDGYLILTTPNLANIYNRILLLIGQPLYNYRPIGFLPNEDHVSLVTKKQMLNLLRDTLSLDVITVDGYSYCERKIIIEPTSEFAKSGRKLVLLRIIMNKILPRNFKEGIFVIAKKIQ